MKRKLLAVIATLVVSVLVGSAVTARMGRAQTGDTGGQVSFTNGFAPVAKKVLPAVVNIASSKIIRFNDKGPQSPFFSNPFSASFSETTSPVCHASSVSEVLDPE
jgi:S1-C subfamily serine protease